MTPVSRRTRGSTISEPSSRRGDRPRRHPEGPRSRRRCSQARSWALRYRHLVPPFRHGSRRQRPECRPELTFTHVRESSPPLSPPPTRVADGAADLLGGENKTMMELVRGGFRGARETGTGKGDVLDAAAPHYSVGDFVSDFTGRAPPSAPEMASLSAGRSARRRPRRNASSGFGSCLEGHGEGLLRLDGGGRAHLTLRLSDELPLLNRARDGLEKTDGAAACGFLRRVPA